MFALILLEGHAWPERVWVLPTYEDAEAAARQKIADEGKEVTKTAKDERQTQLFTEGESYNSYLIMQTE
jgi:phosphoribosyl-ATP pyrophosphohydrolase